MRYGDVCVMQVFGVMLTVLHYDTFIGDSGGEECERCQSSVESHSTKLSLL